MCHAALTADRNHTNITTDSHLAYFSLITSVPFCPCVPVCPHSICPKSSFGDFQCEDNFHDDVIKWKHFPRYWSFVRRINGSPVTSPHKGQWRGALMFSLIGAWINGCVNNGEAGDLRRHCDHYDVTLMFLSYAILPPLPLLTMQNELNMEMIKNSSWLNSS